jgi:integrase
VIVVKEDHMKELNSLQVRQQNTPGRYRAGDCLWLQVTASKTGDGVVKSWLLRYVIDGRERVMGLGSLRRFSLQEARGRAKRQLQLLADGIDPLEAKRQQRDARRAETAGRITFKDAAKRFLDLHERGWKNPKHCQQWRNTLKTYAYPTLGSRPVSVIGGANINEALAPIWTSKPETASRVKQRIERVIQWVKDGMPMPTQGASKRVKHHAALPFGELPGFMAKLRAKDSLSARALEFTILTAARTGEAIGARWDEIDGTVWTVPASRMKGKRDHRVPLSSRAVAILDMLPRDESGFIFTGPMEGRHLSNMAMLQLLRGMNGNGLTVHGFRSTFSDWAREHTHYPRDVVEMALAHAVKDKTEAAYRRGDLLPKRTKLMADWERFCMSPALEGKVVPMQKARA